MLIVDVLLDESFYTWKFVKHTMRNLVGKTKENEIFIRKILNVEMSSGDESLGFIIWLHLLTVSHVAEHFY